MLSEQVLLEQEALRVLQQCSDAPHEREHKQALDVLRGGGAFWLVENICRQIASVLMLLQK